MNLNSGKKYFFPISVYLMTAIMLAFVFNKGFDLTDEGWQLSKSWFFFKGGFSENADLIWGSSFVCGLWLHLQEIPTLLWARLGFLITFPLLPLTVFLILKQFYSEKTAFFSVIFSFLFFFRNFIVYYTINYYWLPVLASLLSLLYFVKYDRSKSLKHIILSAVFAGVSVHLKFTYLTVLPLFGLYLIFFANTVSKKDKANFFALYYAAMTITLAVGFVLLFFSGGADGLISENPRLSIAAMFSAFFSGNSVNSRLDYSFSSLSIKYLLEFKTVMIHTAVPLLLFSGSGYFFKSRRITSYFSGAVVCFLLIIYKIQIGHNHLLLISIFSALWAFSFFTEKPAKRDFMLLSAGFAYIFIISFTGSGMGLYAGLISTGLIGFSALVFCRILSSKPALFNPAPVLIAVLGFILYLQITNKSYYYRDAESGRLTVPFNTPELTGIYSFKERVSSVDGFFEAAAGLIAKEDKTFISGMPALYYLLDQRPFVSETYETILSLDQVKSEITEGEPNVFILPIQSPRGNFWPLERNKDLWQKDNYEVNSMGYYRFYYQYMADNKFSRLFQNDMFAIFKRPKQTKAENK
jgi:hypothetical protein